MFAAPVPQVGSTAPLAARPDPYSQIANPLHTGWGTAHANTPELAPAQIKVRKHRSPWIRRAVALLILALIAGVLWWQRAPLEDKVNDLTSGDENSLVDSDEPARSTR